jgi:DNA-binding LytR/AlgR family response regulator
MAYTCLIADDEDLAVALLQSYVAAIPQLQVVACCSNGQQVLDYVQEKPVDILLLDIQMPQLTGLELAAKVSKDSAVIFTTAYAEYAVESYTLQAVDYLQKPFLPQRFEQAIQKAIDYLQYRRQQQPTAKHITVRSDHRLVNLALADILYVEGRKQYVKIYTTTAAPLMVLDSMKNFETLLPEPAFARIHKSYIVARQHIQSMNSFELTIDNQILPVGKTYKDNLKNR